LFISPLFSSFSFMCIQTVYTAYEHCNCLESHWNMTYGHMSDHSMIDVALGLRCCNQYDSSFYTCRSWRSFSYDDFERDLLQSDLVRCPPDDVSELIAAYDDTLRSMGGASGVTGRGGSCPRALCSASRLPPRCREVTLHVPFQPFLFNCH